MNPATPSAPATVALVATARPTFTLDAARDLLTRARALLTELGADIFGPEDLVMTPDDLEAALADQRADVDLVLNICATFSDASPALRLYDRYPGTDPDLDDLLRAAVHDGARTVVVTRGAEGSAGASGDTFEVASAVSVEARSTLGAGDVFHGALLAAVIRGEPLAGCLTYANTVAAMSCRGLDGRSAIPTHDEAVAFTPSTEARRVQ